MKLRKKYFHTYLTTSCLVLLMLSSCSDENPSTIPDKSTENTSTPRGSTLKNITSDFPVDIIPIFPDSNIMGSSVDIEGDTTVFSITASTSQSLEDIKGFYLKELLEKEFSIFTEDNISEGISIVFTRHSDIVHFSITPNDTRNTFSISGNLHK